MPTYREAVPLVRAVRDALRALDFGDQLSQHNRWRVSLRESISAFLIEDIADDEDFPTATAINSRVGLDSPLVQFDIDTLRKVGTLGVRVANEFGNFTEALRLHTAARTLKRALPTFEAASRLGHG